MAEPSGGTDSDSTFVRGMAIFSAVVTAALYLLGLVAVGLAVSESGGADSTPMDQCRYTSHRPDGAQVLDHEVRLLPLHVMCRTADGQAFTAAVVPSWLNPALAASFASTVAFTAGACVQAHRRAAARHGRGETPQARPTTDRVPDA
ncbi:hypothetical protein GCM10010277_03910 [Streptomyces longisporoflavus]|uniref:hypothetical protein n=1 Tax=Streptomyces longisporoflavus TaxID=28044 RepID=UPI00167EFE71|nr:hypothetical protein [Streptomyces longisporoflavus]GGV23988.1 hypothetical protein GCM10010277_03910 [Streptomyces longisporoflavus]